MVEWYLFPTPRPQKGMFTTQSPEPVNGTLLGKGIFADIIKLKILREDLPGLPKWILNPMTSILLRDVKEDTDVQRSPWEEGGRH